MRPSSFEVRHRDRKALREGYSPGVRRFEIASIVAYCCAMGWLASGLVPLLDDYPWLMASAFMSGFVLADFVSGIVHWLADTWGSPDMPLIGQALIRPFREHHVDEKEITRHDFIETNGNNCFISIVPAVCGALVPLTGPRNIFIATAIFSVTLWVLFTNQFHKWAHLDDPPRWIGLLQRLNLVLPRDHHKIHHSAPFAKYYCITVGWLNEPLYRVRFFQTLEWIISAVTGLVPREDDIGAAAARAVLEETPSPVAPDRAPRESELGV
ncbi:MAG TPA: fatty acid desaturase family protein [Myxococcales bacterium]|nr:fatty acid desaturase family protein [Myxococcales bacterium]